MTHAAWLARFDGQLQTDPAELARYRTDGSACEGSLPDAVVFPESVEDVLAAVELGGPLTVRGGGSGRAGGALARRGGVVLDLTRLDTLELVTATPQPGGRAPLVHAGAGVRVEALDRLLHSAGYWLPSRPWGPPATATVGGLVASGAAGPFARRFGDIRAHVAWLRVVTGGGEVVRLGSDAAGGLWPDPLADWVGSEGRLGVITDVAIRPQPIPPHRVTIEVPPDSLLDGLVETLAADPAVLGFAWVDAQTARLWGASQDLLVLPRTVAVVARRLDDPNTSEGPSLPLTLAPPEGEAPQGLEGPAGLEREITRVIQERHPGASLSRVCPRPAAGGLDALVFEARRALGKHRMSLYAVGDPYGTVHLIAPVPHGDVQAWAVADDVLEDAVASCVDGGGLACGAFGVGVAGERFQRRQHGLGLEVLQRRRVAWDPRGLFR